MLGGSLVRVPRFCFVPESLTRGPFTLRQGLDAGLTPDQLRTSAWKHLSFNWYCWAGLRVTEEMRLSTIQAGLPRGAAFSGLTAARLHGLDLPPARRPEVIIPPELEIADRIQATVRRVELHPTDITWCRGFPVTGPLRTAFDLAGRLPLIEGVVAIDLALHAGLIDLNDFASYVAGHAGRPGVVRARQVLTHAEPKSESPMESRLRMLLVLAGLPRPEAQVDLIAPEGAFAGRADLFYPEARLAVEFDGENHRDRLVSDDRRQNRIADLGVTLLRYTKPDLTERPTAIVAEVSAALRRGSRAQSVHTPGLQRAG